MHGQCDARPLVTFPAAEHNYPLACTKLYMRCSDVIDNTLPCWRYT